MQLHTGQVYRGRMIVTSVTFEVLPKHIVPKLEDIGFDDVEVWFSEEDLPQDWPADRKSDESGFGETQVFLQGRWTGKEDVEVPSGGEQWMLYDIWQHGDNSNVTEYGHRKTSIGKALYVGAWALGFFLVGLPIVLAATSDDQKR